MLLWWYKLTQSIRGRPLIRRPVIRIDHLYESNSLDPNHSYLYAVVQKQTAYKDRPLIRIKLDRSEVILTSVR